MSQSYSGAPSAAKRARADSISGRELPTHRSTRRRLDDTQSHEKHEPKESISGGEHSTEDFTIVLADIGKISPSLGNVFDADVLIHPWALDVDDVEWRMQIAVEHELSSNHKVRLGRCCKAQSMTMRRSTPCIDELEIIMVRLLKGKADKWRGDAGNGHRPRNHLVLSP